MSSIPRPPLRWIAVTTVLTSLGIGPVQAFDPFKPSAILTASAPYQGPTAHGDHWIAYQADASHLEIADRTTGAILRTFELPANAAERTLDKDARIIAADGDHVAALFASRVAVDGVMTSHWSIFVWNVATGLPVGSSNLRFEWFYWHKPFVGIANGRLVVASPTQREIRLWEVATMAPLASVVVPDTILPPLADSSVFQDIVLGGDHLVYFNNGQGQSQIRSQHLVHVNLATGAIKALSQFGDSTYDGHSRPLATDGKHVLITYVGQHSMDVECYDLEAGVTRSFRKIPEETWAAWVSPVFSAPGIWHIGVRKDVRTLRLISGDRADAPPVSTITFDGPGDEMGKLQFASPEGLWFRPGQNPPPGLVAFRQPLNGFPRSVVSVRCEPCAEAQGSMTISVTAKPAPAEPLALHLNTADGSATAGEDYVPLDVEVTLPAGQESVTFPLTVLQDQTIERHESLFVDITRADSGAVIPESRAAGVIRGSSFHNLAPIAAWTSDDPSHRPAEIALAGGHLLQSNETPAYWPPSTVPAVILRPFDSGDWSPSTSWGRTTPNGSYHVEFTESRHGLVLARDPDVIRVFDPAKDEIVHRVEKPNGMFNVPATLGEDHLLTAETQISLTEYPLQPPHTPRALPLDASFEAKNLRYLGDHIAAWNGTPLRLLSRADGSPATTMAGPPLWIPSQISTEASSLATASSTRAWVRDLELHDDHVELIPHDGRFMRVISVVVKDGRVFVTGEKRSGSPTVEVFEAATGVHLDTLLDDPGALQLTGSPAFDESALDARGISVEGNRAALLYWPTIPYQTSKDHHVARFEESETLPSFDHPAPITEGDGEVAFQLTEAVSWPLTVTTRAVVTDANQAEDWIGSGATVVVPAGATSFSSGIATADDHLPEVTRVVALEVTISGNGKTESRRLGVRVTDNDLLPMESVPPVAGPNFTVVAPMGDGWVYRTRGGEFGQGITWTDFPWFEHRSPVGDYERPTFGNAMAASDGWLAVAQDHYGPKKGTEFASRIYIYRPAEGKAPVRMIRGKKHSERFGQTLFARGTSLWVGSPGIEHLNLKPKAPGKAYEYDFANGKLIRTYKAPAGYAASFGSALTANDESTWVASPWAGEGGAIAQFSRSDKGSFIRLLHSPVAGPDRIFGKVLISNDELLVTCTAPDGPLAAGFSGAVQGFSAETGEVRWTLEPPASGEQNFASSLALLPGNLLAVGGRSLFFYLLDPVEPPLLLVELRPSSSPGNPIGTMAVNGFELATQELSSWYGAPSRLFDLRKIPQLLPHLPVASPTSLSVRKAPTGSPDSLALAPTESGWQLTIPKLPAVAESATTETALESSPDLSSWTPVARYLGENTWGLLEADGKTLTSIQAGGKFQFPHGPERRFFRLRFSPSPP